MLTSGLNNSTPLPHLFNTELEDYQEESFNFEASAQPKNHDVENFMTDGTKSEPQATALLSYNYNAGHTVQSTTKNAPMLSELKTRLTPAEKSKFQSIAKDFTYEHKFLLLKQQPYDSPLFKDVDTCNTLYWALENQKVTEQEFMQYYCTLLTYLLFNPKCMPAPMNMLDNLASDITTVKVEDINFSSSQDEGFQKRELKLKGALRYFESMGIDYKNEIFLKVTLNNAFVKEWFAYKKNYILQDKGAETPQVNHICYWLNLLQNTIPIFFIEQFKTSSITHHAYLPPFKLIQACIACARGVPVQHNPLSLKPLFGPCSWNDVKQHRLNHLQVGALWHCEVANSLLQPDGIWFGAGSFFHDCIHAALTSTIPPELRLDLLNLDSETLEPLRKFWQYFIHGQLKNVMDRPLFDNFLSGFKVLCTELNKSENGLSDEKYREISSLLLDNMDAQKSRFQFIPRLTLLDDYRPFIDQLPSTEFFPLFYRRYLESIHRRSIAEFIEGSFILYMIVHNGNLKRNTDFKLKLDVKAGIFTPSPVIKAQLLSENAYRDSKKYIANFWCRQSHTMPTHNTSTQ
ncbi:hypothetical protein D5R81_15900 [Parashewanella spongiae]|uniref:Uncharacterized protein n=1 Tax=Parashewanella spongiae TaxID=342950 RepID=A0A3A6TZY3_9GAMM|nr:hypothetical protein [Parashewanella spongiae]MCL1079527.1 hypothetical protein [Parashewanella spongiae]RJY07405.1 hypothetical protein D5R81_15900 [Parashewanella spongiae]